MATIKIADSVIPSKTNTPLDARCRVAVESDILNIENPFIGMEVYCLDNGKFYVVTGLKSKVVGAITVDDAAVDTYAERQTGTADAPAGESTADKVSVEDTGDYFSGDTVEAVLQEVGETLNELKESGDPSPESGVSLSKVKAVAKKMAIIFG